MIPIIRTLYAYITNKLVASFFLTVVVFTFVLFMGNIVRIVDLIVNKIDPLLIIKYFLYVIPYLLSYTIPMSLLTAVILIFGRMSADNEITAMRASGIGMWKIFTPGIILGILATWACVHLNDEVFAYFHYQQRLLKDDFQIDDPEAFLVPGHNTNDFQGYKINFARKKNGVLQDVTINEFLDNGSNRFIRANRGEIFIDDKTKQITMKLMDGIIEEPDTADPKKFFQGQFGVYSIKFNNTSAVSKSTPKKNRDMTIQELRAEIAVQRGLLAKAGPSAEKEIKKDISKIRVQINERLSYSFACLAFVLVGMPLGVRAHRSEKTVGAAISLGLVAGHYVFVTLAKALAEKPELYPYYLIWIPNVVLALLGVFFTFKIQRR